MRSAANRSSAACRASNAATGNAEERLPASRAAKSGGSDDGNGNERLKKRRFQLFSPNNPAACFLRRLHLRVFIRLPAPVPRALLPSFRRVSICPNPLRCSRSRLLLALKSRRSFRKSHGKSVMWSVELSSSFSNYLPECGCTTVNKYVDYPERRI